MEKKRCAWVTKDALYKKYHDEEWGVPTKDDRKLFELLVLETAQAGLSWLTILKKRENYRVAFDNFAPEKVAKYPSEKISELLSNKGIIRNKRKILSVINNAKQFLKIQKEFGSFSNYIWSFTQCRQIKNHFKIQSEVPKKDALSEKISKDLKKRGFTFLGPTIVYSYLEAIGVLNNHTKDCFKY